MFKKLFQRKAVEFGFDEHMVSLGMLALLVERHPGIPRDALAHIVNAQFNGVNFAAFPDLLSFYSAIGPQHSDGFKALCLVAFALAAGASVGQIALMLRESFAVEGARDLPEFREAERRLLATPAPLTVDEQDVSPVQ